MKPEIILQFKPEGWPFENFHLDKRRSFDDILLYRQVCRDLHQGSWGTWYELVWVTESGLDRFKEYHGWNTVKVCETEPLEETKKRLGINTGGAPT
jgi:hypothetical protein